MLNILNFCSLARGMLSIAASLAIIMTSRSCSPLPFEIYDGREKLTRA